MTPRWKHPQSWAPRSICIGCPAWCSRLCAADIINETNPGPSQWVLQHEMSFGWGKSGGSREFDFTRLVVRLSCHVVSVCACVAISIVCTRSEGDGVGGGDMDVLCWDTGYCDRLPVVSVTTLARCRWPSTRNCGSCTSLLIPTLFTPSFQWYRMSLIVYPTPETCQTHKTLSLTLLRIAFPSRDRAFVVNGSRSVKLLN